MQTTETKVLDTFGSLVWSEPNFDPGAIEIKKAFTLHRPWPTAFTRFDKRIENRSWISNLKPGEWIALHAGAKWDKDGADLINDWYQLTGEDRLVNDLEKYPRGISALMQYTGCADSEAELPGHQHRWYMGRYAWGFSNVQVLKNPIPYPRGRERIWYLKPEMILALQRGSYVPPKIATTR